MAYGVANSLVQRAGFRHIDSSGFFIGSNEEKGVKLYASKHVFDVSEESDGAQTTVVKARCIRQASVNKEAYAITIQLDSGRKIHQAHCNCKAGIQGKCKHAAALVAFINNEDSSTQTSEPNKWKAPSNKQLKLYTKGVEFCQMFPPKHSPLASASPVPEAVFSMNSAQGAMLRAQMRLEENSRRLEELLPVIGWPSRCFSSQQCSLDDIENVEHIMLDADTCNHIAVNTVQQSMCPEWHLLRKERLSASSKAHRIRIRTANFEELARDLCNVKPFYGQACKYGTDMEATARKKYEVKEDCTVTRIGLVISKVQGWLCCSPDGLVLADEVVLLEIKCPFRCREQPIFDQQGNLFVDYLHVEDGKLQLKSSHVYYTQVQVSLYILNLDICHFFVYSPLQVVNVKVRRDSNFLEWLIPKMEWFYFKHYKPQLMKASG